MLYLRRMTRGHPVVQPASILGCPAGWNILKSLWSRGPPKVMHWRTKLADGFFAALSVLLACVLAGKPAVLPIMFYIVIHSWLVNRGSSGGKSWWVGSLRQAADLYAFGIIEGVLTENRGLCSRNLLDAKEKVGVLDGLLEGPAADRGLNGLAASKIRRKFTG